MPRLARTLTLALPLALGVLPQAIWAEDYPFSGHFWLSFDQEEVSNLDRRCALSFLEQRKDGSWSVYHIDLAEFARSKTVVYRTVSEGDCQFNPETQVEACVARMDKSFPDGEGQVVYDVVTSNGADRIDTVMIDAASGWETVMQDQGSSDAGYPLTYHRCPFDEAAVRARINPEPTTASEEELNALRFPSDELLADPVIPEIITGLQGQ